VIQKKLSPFSIIIIFVLFSVVGLSLIHRLNFQLKPGNSTSSLSIDFSWHNASAETVEEKVTSRLEAIIARVQGIKDIKSKSTLGNGHITITLLPNVDPDVVRFEISAYIKQLWPSLPDKVSYPRIDVFNPLDDKDSPLLIYSLTGHLSTNQLRRIADDELKPRIMAIPGIGKIEVWGGRKQELMVTYNQAQLYPKHITIREVEKAIGNAFRKESLGFTKLSNMPGDTTLLYITSRQNTFQQEEIENIPIKLLNDRIVRLGSIAQIYEGEESPFAFHRINGLESVTIFVYSSLTENSLLLGQKVKQQLAQLQLLLPSECSLVMNYDANEYYLKELHKIAIRTLLTLFLLILFILLFTRELKFVLLFAILFVVNLAISSIFYHLFNITIHLYTLAGISIACGFMVETILICSHHIRNHGNKKVWLALFAGTCTLVASLFLIFFLDEKVKVNLEDFVLVIIITQLVSLFSALFLLPALMEKMRLGNKDTNKAGAIFNGFFYSSRLVVRLGNSYARFIFFITRFKVVFLAFFIFAFGMPVFLLPPQVPGERWYHDTYNATLGNEWYQEKVKPTLDKVLGGALRLFVNNVLDGAFFRNVEETKLLVTNSMPKGTTLHQIDDLVSKMEVYLASFPEVKMFESHVFQNNASIDIYFKEEHQKNLSPYMVKRKTIAKTEELGGTWGVYGFGEGYSNKVMESAGLYNVKLLGYNYFQLYDIAKKLEKKLLQNSRVIDVSIVPELSYYKFDNSEFRLKTNKQLMEIQDIKPENILHTLEHFSTEGKVIGAIVHNKERKNIRLLNSERVKGSLWNLVNLPLCNDSSLIKLFKYSKIEKEVSPPAICRENQEYRLYLQFNYVGADAFARKYIEETIQKYQSALPLGYTVTFSDEDLWLFEQEGKSHYFLIGIVLLVIFIICSILFESLVQPFAIILTIPMAYIGVFLVYYCFDIHLDQGGFAAFILLIGISVNSAIFIINDFNNLKKKYARNKVPEMKLYLKAFVHKFFPILLSVISTSLSFFPFLIFGKESFWYSMAAGIIGGMMFSLVAVVIYLPLILNIKKY
jgi:multidrug efflux pump subunit AcrB